MKQNIYSVGQINSYIKNMFLQDFMLNRIAIKGEVSNCKYHTSGHIYFTIKDETGTMACVMFAGSRKGLAFRMEEGQKVIVHGSISVYERDGRYQLYAREVLLDGAGQLYLQFEQLKRELEEMGMFAAEYKQPIPKYSKRIGIITASTGAAIRDIMNVAARRNPYVQLILYPALVQGDGAVDTIVQGIETLEQLGVDVIIVGRGGGSIEDLWAFNEERVASAIFHCSVPIISAVGHETDTTIADYVADLRAPTPSAAAELAVFEYDVFQSQLAGYKMLIDNRIRQQISRKREQLQRFEMRLKYVSPMYQLRQKQQYLLDIEEKLQGAMDRRLLLAKHSLQLRVTALQGLSPLAKLNQGYSYVSNEQGNNIRSVHQVKRDDRICIQVIDGTIQAGVIESEEQSREDE